MDGPCVTVKIDWRNPKQALGVLLGEDVRRFLVSCAAADRRLVQIDPFVPFPSGRRRPVAVTLVGAVVPHASYARGLCRWSQIECEEVGDKDHGPVFKTKCPSFPNPKIFVRVASYKKMYGFGAYIEWLAARASKRVLHFAAFVGLMRRVFGSNTRVRVHNTDVQYFHIKRA
jgi:hypothetical protein